MNDEEGKRVQAQTKSLLDQMRAYRIKRWGKDRADRVFAGIKPQSIKQLREAIGKL